MKKVDTNSQIFDPSNENAFRDILQNDTQAFTPPESAKNEIFKALNFNRNPLYNTDKIGYFSLFKSLKKVIVPISAGLLIFLGTYFVINLNKDFLQYDLNIEDIVNQKTDKANTELSKLNFGIISSNKDKNTKNYPVSSTVNSKVDEKQSSKNQISKSNKNNSNLFNNQIEANTIADNIEKNQLITENLNFSKNDFYMLSNYNTYNNWSGFENNQRLSNNSQPSFAQQNPFVFNSNFTKNKYSFQIIFKGVLGTTFNQNYNFGSDYLNSFLAGAYTTMESLDNFQIGILFGKEPFEKKFFNKEDRDIVEYSLNQSAFWLAIAGKYSFPEVNFSVLNIRPFAEIAIGAGEVGPLARASAGVEQQIIGNLAANISVDFATMFYNNRYNWFTSKKLGVSAGLSYNL